MKKTYIVIAIAFLCTSVKAQEISDALRYSVDNLNGTARYRSMSGAFGALGGDLSSINVNPAGSAVFNNNQLGLTISNYSTKNNSNYFGTQTSDSENSFDLNQAGGVFVFKNHNRNADWTKIAFAVNYENTNNFDNAKFSAGVNPTNSIANYFLSYANGISLNTIEFGNYPELNYRQQQAFFGFHGYIINPVSNATNNTAYTSNVREGGNYYQENAIYSNGYNGKLSFNFSSSYKDKLYIGINLNSHFSNYTQSSRFYEDNDNTLTNEDRITRMRFSNDLYTNGTGFSFQIGTIAKITDGLRLGAAYESPTWMNLSDELTQRLSSVRSNTSGELPTDVIDPRITNYYAPYRLQTPSKFTGSAAYVFGKKGLISVDYSIKDYNNVKFRPTSDDYYRDLNAEMDATLKTSGELRIGAEYKIKALSLRGGYRMEKSPYKNKTTIGDLTGYSGGLGYNFGATRVDLAYSYAKRNYQQGFFSTGLTNAASIDAINNNVSLTVLFEL
ncbi:OmpP1/FadL family transporter [Flavobacterium sp. RSSB_23]|uniref:OmpP1/FadL family transporter n=1 Tax=Flavobacterium sp. RSSB_23 TaxID=3447668 RepID=UPI003F3529B7